MQKNRKILKKRKVYEKFTKISYNCNIAGIYSKGEQEVDNREKKGYNI